MPCTCENPRGETVNVLTVDLEDYFHVRGSGSLKRPSDWEKLPSRVERNTERLLEVLADCEAQATFFVLGWIARRHPALVRKIADCGHEVGSHGSWHRPVFRQTRGEFRLDVQESLAVIEDITGVKVLGYRAPWFSITAEALWAFEVLAELGLRYDSSVFPTGRGYGGLPSFQANPHIYRTPGGARLWLLPISTVKLLGRRVCFFGGGYFRLLPYRVIDRAVKQLHQAGAPVIFYLHPRELDPQQPRLPMSARAGWRTYVGLGSCERKLRRLLGAHRMSSALSLLNSLTGEIQE